MKYKVGDKVRIKSLDWYNENKDEDGDVPCDCNILFLAENKKYLGTIQTVEVVYKCVERYLGKYIYKLKGLESVDWTDEMIEGLVEEETKKEDIAWMYDGKLVAERFSDGAVIKQPKYNKLSINTELCDDKVELAISPDFELKQEGDKWFAVKKQKEYPKTYEECRQINDDGDRIPLKIIGIFTQLINARNAYWKIAGEEMGLGKPWELSIGSPIYYIYYNRTLNHIKKDYADDIHGNIVLAFPTEEMRDAFYENFKELIHECKELL